ncbi:toxin [Bacillus cereus]|nr:toxin [Bacillus cereus]
MKSISKKVMAGLGVGAMSLSIWAPSSEAAAPENNRYYSIHLQANPNIAWDVYKQWESDNAGMRLFNNGFQDNEEFVFFQLDGGSYAIVNKNSGKPVGIGDAFIWTDGVRDFPALNNQTLKQTNWTGSPNEQWYLRDKGNNNYEIVHQGTGKVASHAWNQIHGPHSAEYVDLDDSNPSDPHRVFNIAKNPLNALGPEFPIPGFDHGTFSLPTLPAVGTRPKAPDYDKTGGIDQQLSETSESAVVGASLIPCIMVKDNSASDKTKIHNSPYYVLEKEEYWEKVRSEIVSAGGTSKYTVKRGISTTDQQKMTETLGMSFGFDLGLKFGDSSLAIKSSVSKTLQTEVSKSSTETKEETKDKTFVSQSNKNTGLTVYQLVTRYTLKRTDGSTVSPSWSIRNDEQTLDRTIN